MFGFWWYTKGVRTHKQTNNSLSFLLKVYIRNYMSIDLVPDQLKLDWQHYSFSKIQITYIDLDLPLSFLSAVLVSLTYIENIMFCLKIIKINTSVTYYTEHSPVELRSVEQHFMTLIFHLLIVILSLYSFS